MEGFEIIEPIGFDEDTAIDLYNMLTDEEIMSNLSGITNIVKLLRILMEAVHGEEVRESIHDAILQVYEDATNADPSNTIMEVIIARGEYNSLKERIESIIGSIESVVSLYESIVERMDKQTKILIQTDEPEYEENAVWINPNGTERAETITLSLQNNFTAYSSEVINIPTITKSGNTVHLAGVVSPPAGSSLGSTSTTTICTIPELYRPSRAIHILCQGSTFHKWLLTITTEGAVQASRYSTTSAYVTPESSVRMPFNASWVLV